MSYFISEEKQLTNFCIKKWNATIDTDYKQTCKQNEASQGGTRTTVAQGETTEIKR